MDEKKDRLPKIGVDMDGVIAELPLSRIFKRFSFLKESVFGDWDAFQSYPKSSWKKFLWKTSHKIRKPCFKIFDLIKEREDFSCRLFLTSGRFDFLKKISYKWLKKYNFLNQFEKIFLNLDNKKPADFKSDVIIKEKIDYYIEDDPRTVEILKKKTKAEIFLIGEGNIKDLPEAIKRIKKGEFS